LPIKKVKDNKLSSQNFVTSFQNNVQDNMNKSIVDYGVVVVVVVVVEVVVVVVVVVVYDVVVVVVSATCFLGLDS